MIPSFFYRLIDCRIGLGLFFLALFCFGTGAEENILASPDIDDIAGPVKSVRIEEAWYVDRNGERVPDSRYLSSICEYSLSRLLKERIFFDALGNPADRWIREWDDKGRVVLEAKYKGDNRLITKSEYTYDESGKRSETLKYRYDGALSKHLRHRYNDKGQLIESQDIQQEIVKRKIVFAYDERGNQSSCSTLNPEGKPEVREDFVFDEKGNQVQSTLYNQDNELMAVMTNVLDEKGRAIETFTHSPGGRVELHCRYRYDDRGNSTDMYKYGRDDKFMNREVATYEYDERGNWIVKQESSARPDSNYQLPQRIVYRTIVYFDEPDRSIQPGSR